MHWEGIKWVINYLGCTKNLWLTFGENKKTLLEGFTNADWASQAHRHSVSGFCFHHRQGAIFWSSKKQNIVALSSTKLKYIVLTHVVKEAIWLRMFINEVVGRELKLLTVSGDNQSSLAWKKTTSSTWEPSTLTYFITSYMKHWKMEILKWYIPTEDDIVDIFNKSLAKLKLSCFVGMLGLRELDEWR